MDTFDQTGFPCHLELHEGKLMKFTDKLYEQPRGLQIKYVPSETLRVCPSGKWMHVQVRFTSVSN